MNTDFDKRLDKIADELINEICSAGQPIERQRKYTKKAMLVAIDEFAKLEPSTLRHRVKRCGAEAAITGRKS